MAWTFLFETRAAPRGVVGQFNLPDLVSEVECDNRNRDAFDAEPVLLKYQSCPQTSLKTSNPIHNYEVEHRTSVTSPCLGTWRSPPS